MKQVETLAFVAGAWQAESTTWDDILQSTNPPQARFIFTSWRDVTGAPDSLRGRILGRFDIPSLLLKNACLESNGFSGFRPVLDVDGNLASYSHWSRFVVKQTYERLQPKPTFVRYHTSSQARAGLGSPVHGDHSAQYGWTWHEMTFFVHWTPLSGTTVICFDLPKSLQASVQSALDPGGAYSDDPYSLFAVLVEELLSLYDISVWSIRNHICAWEAARHQDPDYPLLHEISRHATHVSETLTVASASVRDLQQQHRDFTALYDQSGGSSPWSRTYTPLAFPLRVLEGFLSRSESNEARIQSEASLAFHTAAQRDSQIQVRIAEEAKKETSAMKALAVISMTFLPATFVASVFSTPFFQIEETPGGGYGDLFVSSHFWIFCVLAAPLSLFTLAVWGFWDAARSTRSERSEQALDSTSLSEKDTLVGRDSWPRRGFTWFKQGASRM